jgi:hypothetical protein
MKTSLQNLFMAIFKPKEKALFDKLKYWMEEEFIYVYPDFSMELLAEKLGVDPQVIDQMLIKIYKKSFYPLKRHLRVLFLIQTAIDEPESTLEDYAFYGGYDEIDQMLEDIKLETGLDFDGFIEYSKGMEGKI